MRTGGGIKGRGAPGGVSGGADLSGYYTKGEADELLGGKQDKLTAGDNISIDGAVISSTGGGGEAPITFADWRENPNPQTGDGWPVFKASWGRLVNKVRDASLLANGRLTEPAVSTPSGAYPGSAAFRGGVLLPDGRVFLVPRNATTARIYDPVTDTLSTPSGAYPGSSAFHGGVLLPDGRVFLVPRNATAARIITANIYGSGPNFASSPFFNKF